MAEILTEPVKADYVWGSSQLATSNRWLMHLDESDFKIFDQAIADTAGAEEISDLTAADFKFGEFAEKIKVLEDELECGSGIMVVRGLPVHTRYTEDEAQRLFWGIGQHLGIALPQNDRGHMLGHIIDLGNKEPNRRTYESNVAQDFHCDDSDVVGLLCLRPAKEGGVSYVASSAYMHNLMLQDRPDLLPLLYKSYPSDWLGEEPEGSDPWYMTPVYSYFDGLLSARLSAKRIRQAQRFPDVPRLTDDEIAAFDLIESYALREDVHYSMLLQEGDMQFQNNYVTVHSRSTFYDHDDPKLKRHMVRLWLTMHNGRKLAPEFEARRSGITARQS